jgi:hypothetical protein
MLLGGGGSDCHWLTAGEETVKEKKAEKGNTPIQWRLKTENEATV